MRICAIAVCLCLGLATWCVADERPNVMIILADDLGYSDLGCYGSEIETPNLDKLAAGGLQFTQFYNTGRCWPTRAAIMTGYYANQVGRDALPGKPPLRNSGRPTWAPLLPELLAPAGYKSYHSGKWHIDSTPLRSGFHKSYYTNDYDRYFYPKKHLLDDKALPPIEKGSDYYSTTAIADYAIKQLKHHQATAADAPFLSYVAFLAPHFPLHAPESDIVKYRGRYNMGWSVARQARYDRQKERGIVDCELSEAERELGPPYHFAGAIEKLGPGEVNRPLPWDELTEEQKEFQASKMEIHAAMVDRVDQEVGRIVAQLKQMGALENTLILFLSDNGASAEIMVRGDGHNPAAAPGSGESYLCLGPGWSTCSNTPFRRHKTWVHEGGISTPFIAHWPAGIKTAGELRKMPGHVIDIAPTVLELAGIKQQVESDAEVERPGVSLLDAFANKSISPRTIWWLHERNHALRVGDHKIVTAKDLPEWALFDLSADRAEANDLSEAASKVTGEMAKQWSQMTESFREKLLESKRVKK